MTASNGRAPHVAIDARMVADGGIGTYIKNLVPCVAQERPEWRFTLLGDPTRLDALGLTRAPNVAAVAATSPIYTMREQIELPLRTPSDANVYWTPHYNLPLLARTQRLVVTVQDVCHLALPEMTGGPVRRAYARLMLDQVRRRAHGVLFSSHFSRREMERLVGAPSAPTAVSPLAVSGEWWNTKDQSFRLMDGPYFVYVGNFKRHKNIPALLSGFRQVADRIPHSLVLIGRSKGLRVDPAVQQALAGLERRVLLAGEVDDVTLRAYVAHATAFVTASLYEGFGLPPLEAMAAGCPCVVSNAASLPEVCGDAALYCDPRDASSIAARLLEIATNDSARACLIGKGRERARQFTWKRCAEDTVELLEQTLA